MLNKNAKNPYTGTEKQRFFAKTPDVFLACESTFTDSEIVLFGAPFDGTTSFRPGTRFAPKAIRGESFGIETYSPYQDKDLTEINVFDFGDLELPFGNTERVLDIIEQNVFAFAGDSRLPFMVGGEHLVTLGAIRALVKKHPELHVIHFDAHTDLRDDYLGEKLSHATVIRRVWDILGDGKIHQFGIRSGEKNEFEFGITHADARKFDFFGLNDLVKNLSDKPVYFTLDLDVLDPSIFCGTGTPEAGGVTFKELLDALLSLKTLNIVGCDVVELSPPYDQSGVSTAVACKIIREILLIISNK